MQDVQHLMNTKQPYLTDGGFETWMFFVEGFDAPEFAAIVLMDDAAAREKMRLYFDRFLQMAEVSSTGYVLDTNTWRGCIRWADKLGLTEADMLRLSRDAVAFAKTIRDSWKAKVSPILINGVVGPAGDAYVADGAPTVEQAQKMHQPQIDVFAETGVDMVSAITITNVPEAIGIANAARARGLQSVISFTVETDGRLPTGQSLADAIAETDHETCEAPLYYMVNCAHPDHFQGVLTGNNNWLDRIGGVRANASRMSHEELDNTDTLDDGNPEEFGELHLQLAKSLPSLRVVGGCCGTDHRHVACVTNRLHRKAAA